MGYGREMKRAAVTMMVLGMASATALGGGIYWTNRGAGLVERARYDGVGRATVRSGAGTNVRGLALELGSGRIYYADNGADLLYRMNLDGSDRVTVLAVGPSAFPADVRVDAAAGHLYYCDQQKAHLRRVGLDGSNPVVLVSDAVSQPYYLDLDGVGRKIYWGDFDGVSANTGNVFRMNYDGSGRETVVTGNLETRGVCVDAAGGWLYWVNRNAGKVMRCRLGDLPVSALDGTKVQTLYGNLDTPHGLTLDVAAGRVYWVDTGTNGFPGTVGDQGVSRGRMDGSGVHEVLVSLGSEPWDVEVDPRVASYAEWVARFFEVSAGVAGGAGADADGDGVVNVLECALGGHPQVADAGRVLPVALRHAEGAEEYVAVEFVRRGGVAGMSVVVQWRNGDEPWADLGLEGAPGLTTVTVTPLAENLERVLVRSPLSVSASGRQQLRVAARLGP